MISVVGNTEANATGGGADSHVAEWCSRSDWRHRPDMSELCMCPLQKGHETGSDGTRSIIMTILLARKALFKCWCEEVGSDRRPRIHWNQCQA